MRRNFVGAHTILSNKDTEPGELSQNDSNADKDKHKGKGKTIDMSVIDVGSEDDD